MKADRRIFHALAVVGGIMLSGCSAEIPRGDAGTQIGSTADFDEEDKRAAASLSIGNQTAVSKSASPEERARICILSLEFLSERVPQTADVLQQLEAAKAAYENRLEALQVSSSGPAQGTGEATGTDLSDADMARASLTCLQDLQTAG